MDPSILLLDCSEALAERLRRLGFSVATAATGYLHPRTGLPAPIYEYEVIIYNPSAAALAKTPVGSELDNSPGSPLEGMLNEAYLAELRYQARTGMLADNVIRDFWGLQEHIRRRTILLVFINAVTENIDRMNEVYSWVPNMPRLEKTRDSKIDTVLDHAGLSSENFSWLSPILWTDRIKRPVRHTIQINPAFAGSIALFTNKQGDSLGLFHSVNRGLVFLLPEYEDNDYAITTFLTRILPRIGKEPERKDLIDNFNSPTERQTTEELKTIELERNQLDERYSLAKENLASAQREKRRVVENDETAVRIIAYYKQAAQDEDAALFYLYKVVDALKKRFGGETAAKAKLGTPAEWKLIGTKANASYGDIRHAPNLGEKIASWNEEEIADCFAATEKIIAAYFETLF